MLIVPPSLKSETLGRVESKLHNMGLYMNNEKLEVCHFKTNLEGQQICDRALQYLGFVYDGDKVLLRSSTLSRYHRQLHRYIATSERKACTAGTHTRVGRRKIYDRFTMLGRRNFISYAVRAHSIMSQDHKSGIRSQIRRHWTIVNQLIKNADSRVAPPNQNTV